MMQNLTIILILLLGTVILIAGFIIGDQQLLILSVVLFAIAVSTISTLHAIDKNNKAKS
jgi:hypothetical protein